MLKRSNCNLLKLVLMPVAISLGAIATGSGSRSEIAPLSLEPASIEQINTVNDECKQELRFESDDRVIKLSRYVLYRSSSTCVDSKYTSVCKTFALRIRDNKCIAEFYSGKSFLFSSPYELMQSDTSGRYKALFLKGLAGFPISTDSVEGLNYIIETSSKLLVIEVGAQW